MQGNIAKSLKTSRLDYQPLFCKGAPHSSREEWKPIKRETKLILLIKHVKYMSALLLLEKSNLSYIQKQEINPSDLSLGNPLILEPGF